MNFIVGLVLNLRVLLRWDILNIFLYWYSTATGHSWHSKLAFETIPMAVLSIILNVSLHNNINIVLIT